MSVVVVGLNHKTAPISLLERLAISEDRLPKALHQLDTFEHILEGVVLSTCNRVEIYAVVSKFHAGARDMRNFMSEFCHVAPEELTDHLYTYHDDAALRHLFRVAAGADSMVVGESEILGQVRRAFHAATDEGTVGRLLSSAFRRASRVGKRARTETAIGRNPMSISTAAVDLARKAFGRSLEGKRVLIVGAGKMGRLAAKALASSGADEVTIVNRTEERAMDLAELTGARTRPFGELEDALTQTDIAICSTTSPQMLLDRATVERAASGRPPDSPLFIVDIAVPRDVDPEARSAPRVLLRDIDDLKSVVEASRGGRLGEVAKVEEIIGEEVGYFVDWERATEIAPTISTLVARAEAIRAAELARLGTRWEELTPEQRKAVEQLTKRIVAKILHSPLDKAKVLASSKQGHLYLAALRELFELDDEPRA